MAFRSLTSGCITTIIAFAALIHFIGWSSATAAPTDDPIVRSRSPTPSPDLKPIDVVRIQVEALRGNGPENEGIELTYRFASPGNKRSTGPLGRFTEMVRSAPYDRLLNHSSAEYSPVEVSGNKAYQIVTIVDQLGTKTIYLWVLSWQSEGEFERCWMTDAVIVLREQPAGLVSYLLAALTEPSPST